MKEPDDKRPHECATRHPDGWLCLKPFGHTGFHVSWDNTRLEGGRIGARIAWQNLGYMVPVSPLQAQSAKP